MRLKKNSGTPDRGATTGDITVYRDLYDAILDQRLSPGTKLAEDALGEVFGVSRTVVRKALFRLAHENVVRIRPNRGAIVASPTVAEARDVFEARRVVEGAVVRAAAAATTAAMTADLRALVAEELAAFEAGDRRGWIRLSGGFHQRLAEHAGNAVLAEYLKELVSRTSLIIALYQSPGQSVCSCDDHSALIDALAAGDGARAATLMEAHLLACEAQLNLEGRRFEPLDLRDVFADILAKSA